MFLNVKNGVSGPPPRAWWSIPNHRFNHAIITRLNIIITVQTNIITSGSAAKHTGLNNQMFGSNDINLRWGTVRIGECTDTEFKSSQVKFIYKAHFIWQAKTECALYILYYIYIYIKADNKCKTLLKERKKRKKYSLFPWFLFESSKE